MSGIRLFRYGYTYGIYGVLIKGVFILLCIAIIVLIIKRNNVKILCKKCNARVSNKDKICKRCGAELTEENKDMIVKKNGRRVIALCVLVPVLTLAVAISLVVKFSDKNNFLFEVSGSPGIYLERHENGNIKGNMWNVECKALTEGKLKKVINREHKKLKEMKIMNNTDDIDMVLKIEQNDLKESVNIENNSQNQIIDLSKYTDDEIRLTVEHDKSDYINFQFDWE